MINIIKKYKHTLVAASLATFMFSCNPSEDINIDPDEPSTAFPSFLLTSAQKELTDNIWDEWANGRRGMQLSQYWASNQYSDESRYAFRTSVTNNLWSFYYADIIADLNEIIRLNTENPDDYVGFGDPANQIAVAKITRAYMYQIITDTWGAIPYSQAGNPDEFLYPAYDSQEEVYNGIINDLNDAIASINTGGTSVSGDVIYNGDMSKWLLFANSLKLRVGMRIADVAPSLAQQTVSAAVNSGVFQSNADNALYNYLSAAPNNNPLNEDRKTRGDFAMSNVFIDKLLDLGDPRLEFYAAPAVSSSPSDPMDVKYVGEVYGLAESDAANTADQNISQPSSQVLEATAPGIWMTYAEVQFLLAEGVERGFVSGSAADYYNEGITASMNYWSGGSLSSSDISSYIAQPNVSYNALKSSGMEWNEIIGQQKWIALYMQGLEAWAEYRRLDFGVLQAPAAGALEGDGSVPARMLYPLNEQTSNGESYTAAVAAQGADLLSTKLWWDVK
ncbi:SusD/RagB family nutrient-binding outer membrane lipoprotein [Bernardetia sp.]|uniref:SusD/RagB family nutrient-binding outer membrane lipoprotein n=1 Tax=Bernardetia sp. TaxID=1937974 RepID=UPI0025C3C20F|nr:SusD/RagB family nutrient-binding outer membrane lipoprotein [Bernardetia sp.]